MNGNHAAQYAVAVYAKVGQETGVGRLALSCETVGSLRTPPLPKSCRENELGIATKGRGHLFNPKKVKQASDQISISPPFRCHDIPPNRNLPNDNGPKIYIKVIWVGLALFPPG